MESTIISWVAIGISLLGVVSPFIFTYFKSKRQVSIENNDLGSDAVDTTAKALSISNDAMSQVKSIRSEMADMCTKYESEISNLKTEVVRLREAISQRDEELLELRDWAERLVYQVKSLGGVPVEMRKKDKKPKEKS